MSVSVIEMKSRKAKPDNKMVLLKGAVVCVCSSSLFIIVHIRNNTDFSTLITVDLCGISIARKTILDALSLHRKVIGTLQIHVFSVHVRHTYVHVVG